jgi:hypothetical protein
MKFRAYVDQGHWANQLHRLAAAMGKSLDEAVKQQAGLVCIDCMRLTPPFPSTTGVKGDSKALRSSFGQHKKAGEAAIMRDLKRVFRPASMFPGASIGDSRAEAVAKLAKEGNLEGIKDLFKSGGIKRLVGIKEAATREIYKAKRNQRGRVSPTFRGFLLHTGIAPQFEDRRTGKIEAYGGLASLYKATIKRLGMAKAGWLKAADALGVGKRVPAWVRRHGTRNGIFRHEGEGVRQSVVLGSGVPYMQYKGRDLGIVTIALEGRQRLIEKQIAATLRKRKVVS